MTQVYERTSMISKRFPSLSVPWLSLYLRITKGSVNSAVEDQHSIREEAADNAHPHKRLPMFPIVMLSGDLGQPYVPSHTREAREGLEPRELCYLWDE